MDCYEIEWCSSAEREVRRIERQFIRQIVQRIDALAHDPFPHGSRKLVDRHGTRRVRVGEYRVLYEVDQDARKIIILAVRRRDDAYR